MYQCRPKEGAPLPPGVTGPLPEYLAVKMYGQQILSRSGDKMKTSIEREYQYLTTVMHPFIMRIVALFFHMDDMSNEVDTVYLVLERAPAMPDGPLLLPLTPTQR